MCPQPASHLSSAFKQRIMLSMSWRIIAGCGVMRRAQALALPCATYGRWLTVNGVRVCVCSHCPQLRAPQLIKDWKRLDFKN